VRRGGVEEANLLTVLQAMPPLVLSAWHTMIFQRAEQRRRKKAEMKKAEENLMYLSAASLLVGLMTLLITVVKR